MASRPERWSSREYVNMADIKTGVNSLVTAEADLREGVELLFYAYRDFTAEPDAMLAKIGLGRAHHRVIYFVGRYPGITVTDLLAILRITKQSLSRVLGDLLEQGYVGQRQGTRDRRQRLLTLTDKGQELERALTETQCRLLARAEGRAGEAAWRGFRELMLSIMDETDRSKFTAAPAAGGPDGGGARRPAR
jgi:DNA-binding MarR family transcriptional regulator